MHVQSISCWAPANIGPYSQLIEANDALFIAGIIGMIPDTLLMPDHHLSLNERVWQEACLSIKHIQAILSVSRCPSESRIIMAICYITDFRFIPIVTAAWNTLDALNMFSPPFPTFAVVKSLPKNALIEWNLVANTGDNILSYIESAHGML